jgi:hypothetical protein
MNPLVVMLIWAPIHLWESERPALVPGWTSVRACESSAPYFEREFGVTNTIHEGLWNTERKVFLPAKVVCRAFPNEPGP